MKNRTAALIAIAACGVACAHRTKPRDSAPPANTPPPAALGPEALAVLHDLEATHEQRMRWWREARFGLFIHWGVYAVPAGTWAGQQVKRSGGEWIMNRGKIPVADYQKLPSQFNPTKFDAEAWVALAKEAGMKYIVITAKHHDGFAMFDSQSDPFNIVAATPWRRDPLQELAEASRKAGIKLGFYYSQAQDWNHRGGAASGGHWDAQAQDGSMDEYIDKVAVPQVKELLTKYGPVAVLWWDTPVDMTPERSAKLLPLLRLQPEIVQNNRLIKGKLFGDFETPEQKIPPNGLPGKDWETCMTINGTWGFRSYDNNWKSAETLVRNLIDITSKGGNYLLNVGPTSEGEIPGPSVERLRAIGAWMRVNGEAIHGTSASPFAQPLPWGRVTRKVAGGVTTLYLHVFEWPKDGKLMLPGVGGKIATASLLVGGAPLAVSVSGADAAIAVPAAAPDPISSTVVVRLVPGA